MDLTNASAIVTGGAGGFGSATVRTLAQKTVLVQRFCDELPGSRFRWGGCDPLATPAPLGPLVDVADGLAGAATELMTTGARPYEVARALLDGLRATPSAVVVLEDLHWADEGTLEVLAYLAPRLERVRALVICTYRDDELKVTHPLRTMLGGWRQRRSSGACPEAQVKK